VGVEETMYLISAREATALSRNTIGSNFQHHKCPCCYFHCCINELIPWATSTSRELYDTASDPSESHDVAAQFPDKLRELQRLWIEESIKYNVFPLNDNLGERIKQAYIHFAPR
jgi:hypothetical protein